MVEEADREASGWMLLTTSSSAMMMSAPAGSQRAFMSGLVGLRRQVCRTTTRVCEPAAGLPAARKETQGRAFPSCTGTQQDVKKDLIHAPEGQIFHQL